LAVHIIHISKSGGSAIRFALREARRKAGGKLQTEWGPVWGHDHRFRLVHVGPDDKAIFALRDPISRFISGFHSRLREGKPRYDSVWTPKERRSFEWFSTPGELAEALAQPRGRSHARAVYAMRRIRHVKRPMTFWLGSAAYLYLNRGKILHVARQESLDEDWEEIKELLGLPREQMLPDDHTVAHRTSYTGDMSISEEGLRALRRWYAEDYRLLKIAEALRHGQEPPVPPTHERMLAQVATVRPRRRATNKPRRTSRSRFLGI
jgi:Sulfotransferase family